jgi:hypothetical protein
MLTQPAAGGPVDSTVLVGVRCAAVGAVGAVSGVGAKGSQAPGLWRAVMLGAACRRQLLVCYGADTCVVCCC